MALKEKASPKAVTWRVPHLEKEINQMKKVMEEIRNSMRRTSNVDDLVHITDSSFTTSVISHPLSSKFKMPILDLYDGL